MDREGLVAPDGERWFGQARDCGCVDAFAHDRDRDRGADSVCDAHRRRRGLVLLEQFRARAAEQVEDEALIRDHSPERVADLSRLLDAINEVLVSVDASELDGDALMGSVLALEGTRRRLDAATASLMGLLDRRGVTEATVGLGVKRWKANRTHGSDRAVGRELTVARTLERFEGLAVALAAGEVSVDHVLAVAAVCNARVTDLLVELEDKIVRVARLQTFRHFQMFLRRLVSSLDQDGPEPDCGDVDTAAMGRDLESNLHLRLELSGHNAVTVERIINDETDRQYRAAVKEAEATGGAVPQMGVLRARAVVELLRRGAQANPNSARPAVEASVSVTADSGGRPTSVNSIDGYTIDQVAAAVLICDAALQPVACDRSGVPINLGRIVRRFTHAQRNALITRDGGCAFPGCDQPASRCDAHHELPWESGGRTDLDNGVLLCRRHHGLVHCGRPWVIIHRSIDDLPAELLEAHRLRAESAHLEPATGVRLWQAPNGKLLLAQNASDHNGPAPPRRAAA